MDNAFTYSSLKAGWRLPTAFLIWSDVISEYPSVSEYFPALQRSSIAYRASPVVEAISAINWMFSSIIAPSLRESSALCDRIASSWSFGYLSNCIIFCCNVPIMLLSKPLRWLRSLRINIRERRMGAFILLSWILVKAYRASGPSTLMRLSISSKVRIRNIPRRSKTFNSDWSNSSAANPLWGNFGAKLLTTFLIIIKRLPFASRQFTWIYLSGIFWALVIFIMSRPNLWARTVFPVPTSPVIRIFWLIEPGFSIVNRKSWVRNRSCWSLWIRISGTYSIDKGVSSLNTLGLDNSSSMNLDVESKGCPSTIIINILTT